VRRTLRKQLPALSYHFGLLPWDIDRLLFGEVTVYLEALKALSKE
jgi:hypothetical protein